MPSDPESVPELARMLRTLEGTIERRFTALENMLRGYVSAELHAMYERRTDERMAEYQKDLDAEVAARKSAIKDEATTRENAIADMRKTYRWVVAAVVIPGAAVVATIVAIIAGRL